MEALCTPQGTVRLFDRVSVDGKLGTAVGFYAREERTVLVNLDFADVLEVLESRVVVEPPLPEEPQRTRFSWLGVPSVH